MRSVNIFRMSNSMQLRIEFWDTDRLIDQLIVDTITATIAGDITAFIRNQK